MREPHADPATASGTALDAAVAGLSPTAAVIQRIGTRLAPPGVVVTVTDLALDGHGIWLTGFDRPAIRTTTVRLHRELALIGWHVNRRRGADGELLVLGWSHDHLAHRAHVMRTALAYRLADFSGTARTAALLTVQTLQAVRPEHHAPLLPDAPLTQQVVAHVCGEINARHLRWPDRLADLDGLQRTAGMPQLRQLLAQVTRLEEAITRRCQLHLTVARWVAQILIQQLNDTSDQVSAIRRTLADAQQQHWSDPAQTDCIPVHSALFHLVAATVPNHPPADPGIDLAALPLSARHIDEPQP